MPTAGEKSGRNKRGRETTWHPRWIRGHGSANSGLPRRCGAGRIPEFEKRNTKIIGLSVDAVGDHARWSKDIEETPGPPRHLPADWRSRAQGREALRHAAGRSGRYIRRPNAGEQWDGTLGLRYRAGQKDQDHADLSDDDRAQFRRGAADPRLGAADGEASGRDPGQLEARRGRHHRRFGVGRGGAEAVPGLPRSEAIPALYDAAALNRPKRVGRRCAITSASRGWTRL